MKRCLLSLCTVALLSACKQEAQQMPEEPIVKSVKYQEVTFSNHAQTRELSGVVTSSQTSPLSFKVKGTVDNLYVNKGQKVEKGAVLATLDQHDFTLAVQKAKAGLGAASAARVQAEDKYNRSLKLNEKGFVSESELKAIEADFDAKLQQQMLAETDLFNAELSLERTALVAPFSGQISEVAIDDFTEISSGQKVIELVNDHFYQIDFLLPEALINRVTIGTKVNVNIPALGVTQTESEVSEIGAVVKKGNAYAVTLALSDKLPGLRNGMSANINIQVGSLNEGVVLLPLEAINLNDKKGEGEAAIFVINDDLTLEKRYVTVQHDVNSEVVVLDKLSVGEKVVVAGIPYLYEGQTVSLWTAE